MIGKIVSSMLRQPFEQGIMIPGDNTAHVNEDHSVQHAALVLATTGYNSIPVLDNEDHFVGVISLAAIIQVMFEIDDIEADNIDSLYVRDVMDPNYPVLKNEEDLDTMLHLLVDRNYVPVIDLNGVFKGIVTRKAMLKGVNYLAHRLEVEYNLTKKDCKK